MLGCSYDELEVLGQRLITIPLWRRFMRSWLMPCLGVAVVFSVSVGFCDDATLDRFEIQTNDNNEVKVVLYTEGRADYTVDDSKHGFALVLKDTKLSQRNLKSGLPVVIDNKNQFIGRAVPTADQQLKILIPNLPADQYSVSVIQRPAHGNTDSLEPIRPNESSASTQNAFDSQFENIAKDFRPSRRSRRSASSDPAYTDSQQAISPRYYFPKWHASSASRSTKTITPTPISKKTPTETYNTLALSESTHPLPAIPNPPIPSKVLPYQQIDPGVTTVEDTTMDTTALSDDETAVSEEGDQPTTHPLLNLFAKNLFPNFPVWVVLLIAVFFGGVGLFGLLGALLFARLLLTPRKSVKFSDTLRYPMPTLSQQKRPKKNKKSRTPWKAFPLYPVGLNPLRTVSAAPSSPTAFMEEEPSYEELLPMDTSLEPLEELSPYTLRAEEILEDPMTALDLEPSFEGRMSDDELETLLAFQDRSHMDAASYFIQSAQTVKEAVANASRVKMKHGHGNRFTASYR